MRDEMNKRLTIGAMLLCVCMAASAAMDDKVLRTGTLAANTAITNSSVVRGTVEAVTIDMPAGGAEGTVTVWDDYRVIFTRAVTADSVYYPTAIPQTSTGANATNELRWASDYGGGGRMKIPVAGVVYIAYKATTATTNATVKLLYSH